MSADRRKSGAAVAETAAVSFFGAVLEDLDTLSAAAVPLFAGTDRPNCAGLDAAIAPAAFALLEREDRLLVGAGFVASENALADAVWHMAWWQGHPPQRLSTAAIESAAEIYSRREWFTVPLSTGRKHVTGPYVDFLCTDEYTLTLTAPVAAGDGAVVGVVGADIFVETLEKVLLADLRAAGDRATLVNRAGRVVLSADPQLAAGRLYAPGWEAAGDGAEVGLRNHGVPGVGTVRICADLPLAVIVPGSPEGGA